MFLQRDEPLTHPAVIFFHIFAGIITEPDMKFVHILLSATILASSSPALRAGESDDLIMKNEASAFLSNMPENLQHIQSEAIIKAIGGNLSDLEAVRNSRNTPPPLPEDVEVRQMTDRLRIYEPKTAGRKPLPALIYLHGGGWTFGSLNSCARFCGAVASGGNIKVIAVDYRLAPENPFPAGLNDCIESLKFVSSRCDSLGIDPDHIAIGGDSSGGNLAVATALAPECKGLLNALILFYPVTKAYTDGSDSWNRFGKGYGLDSEIMETFNRAYLAGESPRNPAVSVALCSDSDLERLPPTLLVAAGHDILRDQGIEFAERLGSRVRRIEFPEACHLFITVAGQEKAFEKAVGLTRQFLEN